MLMHFLFNTHIKQLNRQVYCFCCKYFLSIEQFSFLFLHQHFHDFNYAVGCQHFWSRPCVATGLEVIIHIACRPSDSDGSNYSYCGEAKCYTNKKNNFLIIINHFFITISKHFFVIKLQTNFIWRHFYTHICHYLALVISNFKYLQKNIFLIFSPSHLNNYPHKCQNCMRHCWHIYLYVLSIKSAYCIISLSYSSTFLLKIFKNILK